jgi:phosphopentomutase
LDANYSGAQAIASAIFAAASAKCRKRSTGKDTTTGHWEIAGVIVDHSFSVFERFPYELVHPIVKRGRIKVHRQLCGQRHGDSGTTRPEHIYTGRPILYTSAGSLLQIAAHEEIIPPKKLHVIGQIARKHANGFRIGRVIAPRSRLRKEKFMAWTSNRHDSPCHAAHRVERDHRGEHSSDRRGKNQRDFRRRRHRQIASDEIELRRHGGDRPSLAKKLGAQIFANLVDFDSVYGHRRDPGGYANALEELDHWLGNFIDKITPQDLVIITADHGNDPTFRGTDHTCEQVPLFVLHNRESRDLGTRSTYADVAASLAEFFALPERWAVGTAFQNHH